MWLTWKHEEADFSPPLTFDQKVEVFYEQTLGWQLHIADLLANGGTTFGEFKLGQGGYPVPVIRHSGFAVLHICLSYFELIGSLLQAKPQSSSKAFNVGIRAVPDAIDPSSATGKVLRKLYDGARCGLYHEGRTRLGIGLGQPPDGKAIAYVKKRDMIGISPERLPRVLKAHLAQFRLELLNPANTQLRERFEHRFDRGFSKESSHVGFWKRLFSRT